MTTFKDLGLSESLLTSLDELGFTEPTPIQVEAIPLVINSDKDLIALAQTGTGKTAAFGLPILGNLKADGKSLQAIILCPTRELCIQIARDLKKFAAHDKGVGITAVYGGESIGQQIGALKRGTNVVVGTPGRVHDLIRRGVLKLQGIEWLVLDEADEMLDMGFKDDLDAILEQTPATRRTLLFSATLSKSVHAIAKEYMKDAEEISMGVKNAGAANVSHEYYVVKGRDRYEALTRILDNLPGVYGILFCRTRAETQEIADKLKRAHYDTEALHGDISQSMRTRIMDGFKKKKKGLLVATDVAARGIDVSDLTHVINYNLPDTESGYTHRSGRTGRAHKSGVSISIVTAGEARRIKFLQAIVGKKFEHKTVPTQDDILRRQVDSWLTEIEQTETDGFGSDSYFTEAAIRLEHLSRADLIKHFVAHRFARLRVSQGAGGELDDKPQTFTVRGGGEETGLKINVGKRDGLNIKEFFGLINSCPRLKGLDIGRIDLGPKESMFSLDSNFASEAVRSLSTKNFRGQRLFVTLVEGGMPAAEAPSGSKTRGFARDKAEYDNKKFGGGKTTGFRKPAFKKSGAKKFGAPKASFKRKSR